MKPKKTKPKAKATKPKKPVRNGRPSDYRKEYAHLAYRFTLLGHTDAELAVDFGVAESTINRWKLAHPEFCESIKRGRTPADCDVVESLYKRACGFTKRMVKMFQYNGEVIEHEYDEYFPPEVGAMVYWLKNRQRALFRDRPEISVEVNATTLRLPDWAIDAANDLHRERQGEVKLLGEGYAKLTA